MPIEPTHFPSRDTAVDQMVAIISAGLKEAINLRGKASLMLSGGSTPGPVYKALSDVDLDWSKVTVGLVDDRYVHDTDSRSNAKLVRETLLQGKAAAATFLPMVGDGVDPFEHAIPASEVYNQALPIDISVMGLGPDGHTASWFPEARGVEEAMDPAFAQSVAGIDASNSQVAGDTPLRITLTASALNTSRLSLLLMFGADKVGVYRNAVIDQTEILPITHYANMMGDRMMVLVAD